MGSTIASNARRRRSGYRGRPVSSRSSLRRASLSALVATALITLPVASAVAQQSPFNPIPAAPATQPATQTTATTSTTTSGGLSTFQSALIVIGGVGLLTGIAYFIVRDARRNAPITKGESEAATIDPDSHAQRRRAKQKQRARQKAAKAQRRRNR